MKSDHYIDHGGEGEVIILLHGFLSSSKYWRKLQPLLSKAGYRIIAIDLLGFGKATKPTDGQYDYDDHVAFVHTTLQEIGITNKFHLIGHSMGALIASRYGTLYPDDVHSLILLHPPLYASPHEARQTLRSTGMLYRFLLDSSYRQLAWLIIRSLPISIIGRHSQQSREKSLRNVIEAAEIFDDLSSIRTDTLLVVGTNDRKEYIANIAKFQLSEAVTVTLEAVNHHSPRNQPLLLRDTILTFIS
jgi:pimeloyl-ACP methyl ester carboxylesterase